MFKHAIVPILCSTLFVIWQTGHAQPPPALIGDGIETPRGMPAEGRADRARDMEPRREARGRGQAEDEETRRLRQELEARHRDQAGREHERFRWEETEIIREWYGQGDRRPSPGVAGGQRGLPPGLQRRVERGEGLPPGWQRKVDRGEVLSQEQVRHGRRIDETLRRRLPPQPEGTVLMETEDQVIRVLEATGEVLDVFGVGRR